MIRIYVNAHIEKTHLYRKEKQMIKEHYIKNRIIVVKRKPYPANYTVCNAVIHGYQTLHYFCSLYACLRKKYCILILLIFFKYLKIVKELSISLTCIICRIFYLYFHFYNRHTKKFHFRRIIC